MNTSSKLGMTECIMLLIGAMVGSAIFSLSGLTILTAGPAAVLSWLAAGLIMLLYGMCMGELACRYPKSGGVYYFPRLTFSGETGQWLGWLSCWSCILTNIAAIAFSAIYVGIYLSITFPCLAGFQFPIAVVSILLCLFLNLIRVDLAGRINAMIVLLLLSFMVVYIGYALFGGKYDEQFLVPFFHQGTEGVFGFIHAIPTAMIGYSGIVALAFMVSDVKEPRRTIPLAMLISILLVALLYAMMILSTLGLVTSAYLQANPNMCFIPMFCACFTKLNSVPWLTGLLSIAAVLALMTTMVVCVSINARAIQAAGEDGILPALCGKLNAKGVPAAGSLITCVIALIYSYFPQYTQQIVNFGAVFNIITMLLTMLALLQSRRIMKEEGAFTVPGGNVIPILVLVILFVCNAVGLFAQGSRLWLYTFALLILGVAVKLRKGIKSRKS